MNTPSRKPWAVFAAIGALLAGCAGTPRPPLQTVPKVDLQRFMGDWYVIGNIPTFIERDAYNALESYKLERDGTIATTFTYRNGGFDGAERKMEPRGFVLDSSNAVWGMRFVWPIKADYRIAYLDEAYSVVVVAREKRDYLWIMARQPQIDDALYQRLVAFAVSQGYDAAQIRKVPQKWPQEGPKR